MTGRVIAICIEVASPEWMKRWLTEGRMPNLAAIRAQGNWAELNSVAEVSSGSIWPSFVTGLMPAGHGQFFTHMQLENGSYRVVKKYADDLHPPPFWAELTRVGKTAAIIDVPQTRPMPGFQGVHVVGWGGEYPAWPRSSYPPLLMDEILARFGPHPLAETRRIAARPETMEECRQLREDLLRGVRGKAGISRMMLERGPYDLFLTVFAEPHWAMHLFWDTLDPDHPKHDPQRADTYASTFTDVLAEIDQFIGDAKQRHPEADLLVFSLSGMGPNYSGWHLLPEVLKRLGMGLPNSSAASMSPLRRWGPHALRRLDSLVPASWIERVKQAVPERLWDRATRGLLYRGAGWAQSKAFWLPNDYSGAIRINLAGREPMGKVSPGRDYDFVCDQIETALLDLVEVNTGRPAVRRVIRTQQALEGAYRDDLPDLIVLWADSMPLEKVQSERLGRIELQSPERRSGGHRNKGFLIAAGPNLPTAGPLDQEVSVVDLAPTILDLLQVERPAAPEGKTLRRLVAGVAA